MLLLLCAIDGTKFENYPLAILAALLKVQAPIDKTIFVSWIPWRHTLLSFWLFETCSLRKWFYILQLFLEHGADPNYRLPRVAYQRSYRAQSSWSFASSVLSSPDLHPNSPPISPSFNRSPLMPSLSFSGHPILPSSPSPFPPPLSPSLSPQRLFSPAEERQYEAFNRPGRTDSEFITPLQIIVDRSDSARRRKDDRILAEYKWLVELLFSYGADPMLPDSNGELFNVQIEEIMDLIYPGGLESRSPLMQLKLTNMLKYSARTWGKHSLLPLDMSGYRQCPEGFMTLCDLMVMTRPKTARDASQSKQKFQID